MRRKGSAALEIKKKTPAGARTTLSRQGKKIGGGTFLADLEETCTSGRSPLWKPVSSLPWTYQCPH